MHLLSPRVRVRARGGLDLRHTCLTCLPPVQEISLTGFEDLARDLFSVYNGFYGRHTVREQDYGCATFFKKAKSAAIWRGGDRRHGTGVDAGDSSATGCAPAWGAGLWEDRS